GKDARVRLELTDGTKVKGYVNEIKDNSFFVVSDVLSAPVEINYSSVKRVNGTNIPNGVKSAIGVIAVLAALSLIGMAAD
ncbi:MAG TPA: hypothetical protein VL501_05800, partial [Pyrinomonadaceae bacterium]|nr:hypothetical protein [Pyrinomonadaceae bacterium]